MPRFCRCTHNESIHAKGGGCTVCPCKGFSVEPPVAGYFGVYALANGRNVTEQLAHDSSRFPGGKMAGYLAWMTLRVAEFKALSGIEHIPPDGLERNAFDEWIRGAGCRPSVALDDLDGIAAH